MADEGVRQAAIEKGRKEGEEKGLKKGRKERELEIAQALLQQGLSIKQVVEATDLTEGETKKL